MLTPLYGENILHRRGSNPRRCIKQDSEPNTLPTSYSGPLQTDLIDRAIVNNDSDDDDGGLTTTTTTASAAAITTTTTTTWSTSVDPPPPPPPWLSFFQPTLSQIAVGKQSLGTPVSVSSRSTVVRVCPPTLLSPCFGSHRTKSLTNNNDDDDGDYNNDDGR